VVAIIPLNNHPVAYVVAVYAPATANPSKFSVTSAYTFILNKNKNKKIKILNI